MHHISTAIKHATWHRKVTDLVKTEVAVNNNRIATLELNIFMTRNVNMTMQYI